MANVKQKWESRVSNNKQYYDSNYEELVEIIDFDDEGDFLICSVPDDGQSRWESLEYLEEYLSEPISFKEVEESYKEPEKILLTSEKPVEKINLNSSDLQFVNKEPEKVYFGRTTEAVEFYENKISTTKTKTALLLGIIK